MTHTLRKISTVFFLGILLSLGNISTVTSQTTHCPNAGFEMGDFTYWQGFTGSCCPIYVPNPGIVPGQHTIITAPGTDPNTCDNLQILPAFAGGQVCRLGNEQVGAQAEQLRYDLAVDSNNALFVYRYAVVLQDPGHSPADQPRFQIRVLDSLGNVIDPICGQYFVEAGQNIPGFQYCATYSVVWKDWTTVGINLSPYIGQDITLEFSTGDCALSGHFGYAYLDCYCMPNQIQSEFCIGSGSVNLVAPPGFSSYLWSTGDTTITTSVNNPVIGQQVTCMLTTVQNCALTLTTTLNSTVINPSYSVQVSDPCNPAASVQFTDGTTIQNGTLTGWNWNFGDNSSADTNQSPVHTFPGPGSYQVTLHAFSLSGCVDSVTTTVDLFNPASAAFSSNAACLGDATVFADQSTAGNDTVASWSWNFGDNLTGNVQNPQHTYGSSGSFPVTLIITTNNGCTDTLVQNINVNPLPVISTTPSTSICLGDAATISASGGNTYEWSPSASLSASTGSTVTANPTVTTTYTVVGRDANQCSSSASVTVTVNPLPLVVSPANLEICAGNCAVLTMSGAFVYTWTPSADITAANPDSSIVTVCPGATTIYTVVGHSQEGCTASISFNVEVNPIPVAQVTPAGPVTICSNSPATLTAATGPGYTYQWYLGANQIPGATNSTYNATTNGLYSVVITANNCTATSNIVTVALGLGPDVSITMSPTIGCLLNTIYIGYGPQSVTLTAMPPAASYLWSNGATTQSISVTTPGAYSVTAFDASGCPSPNPAVLTPALNVVDIRCGQGKKKIILCHVPPGNLDNPQTICIAPSAIPSHLEHHDHDCIGPCSLYYPRMASSTLDADDGDFFVLTHPNPFNNGFNLYVLSGSNDEVIVNIYDMLGRVAETYRNVTDNTMIGTSLSDGMYTAEVQQGQNRKMLSIIKSNK